MDGQSRERGILGVLCEQAATAADIREQPGDLSKWIGVMVKKGFPQITDAGVKNEFMWVRVTGTRGDRLLGRLANRPVLATYLASWDEVEITEAEVFGAEWPDDPQRTNAGGAASMTTDFLKIVVAAARYRREEGRHRVSLDQCIVDDLGVVHLRTAGGRWIAMYDEQDGHYTRLGDDLVRLAAGECGCVD